MIFLVFLYSIDRQQSIVLCCHKTPWLVALPGFLNFSHVPGNANVMSLVITAAPSLVILRSEEAILIPHWA